jgi:hypothetical protein
MQIDQDAQHIEMLKTQVQLLTTQLTLLTEKRARKKKAKAAAQAAAAIEAQKQAKKPKQPRPKPTPTSASTGFPKPPKQPRQTKKRAFADLDPEKIEELTYEQKRELSENINILTQEQLARVLQIIRENTHIDEVRCALFYFMNAIMLILLQCNNRVKVKRLNWTLTLWTRRRSGSCTRM